MGDRDRYWLWRKRIQREVEGENVHPRFAEYTKVGSADVSGDEVAQFGVVEAAGGGDARHLRQRADR